MNKIGVIFEEDELFQTVFLKILAKSKIKKP